MKGTLVFTVTALLMAQCFALRLPLVQKAGHIVMKETIRTNGQAEKVGLDKCKTCIDFAGQALNELLNIILQGGVVGGCADLCGALASKTSPAIGTICNILCDVAGIEEFIKIIKKADLDPIYYCELIPACPIMDNGDAMFTSFGVTPKSGPQGKFDIAFAYSSKNGTGTGEIDLEIATVDGIPVGQAFLHEMAAAGDFTGDFQVSAVPDPDCDPSQGPCEMWEAGDYTVKIAICNGECGSQHPHSAIYDQASATFTITN